MAINTFQDFILLAKPTNNSRTAKAFRLFCELNQNRPEILPAVIDGVDERVAESGTASVREVYNRVCCDKGHPLDSNVVPLAARFVLFVRPDLRRFIRVNPSQFDQMFCWEDEPKQEQHPVQLQLFTEAA